MRAARLLSIQMLLVTRGQMSARSLAEILEVSVRTLHRDVDQLTAAGVPVVAERGAGGGFRLLDGWSTQLTGLTASEAQAVFLSGLAGPASELGLGANVRNAQLKLLASLPPGWREQASRIMTRVYLDPADWYREPEPVPCLGAVARAIWSDREIDFTYESWTRTTRKVAAPLGLVLKAGTWYFVARMKGQDTIFRVSALKSVTLLDAQSKRPKGFDLEAAWRQAVRSFEASLFCGSARVRATKLGLKLLAESSAAGARAVRAASAGVGKWTELTVATEALETASRQFVMLAPDIEVLSPPALRNAIRRRAAEILRTYGAPHSKAPP